MELSAYIKSVIDNIGSVTSNLEIEFEVTLSQDGEVVDNGTNIVRFTLNLEEPEETE